MTESTPLPPIPVSSPLPLTPPIEPQNNLLSLLLIPLVLVLIASTGYFAYQYFQLKTQVATTTPSPTPITSLTPNSTPTSTFTTDINSVTKWHRIKFPTYQFEVPPSWIVDPLTGSISNYEIKTQKEMGPTIKDLLKIEIHEDYSSPNINQFVDKAKQEFDYFATTPQKESRLIVSGQEAIKIDSDSPGFWIAVQDPNNKTIVEILFGLDFDNYRSLANQILSTFKFLDQTSDVVEITQTATKALVAFLGEQPTNEVVLASDTLKISGGWAFGTIVIKATPNVESGPEAHYFLAKQTGGNWQAAIEYTQTFKDWLKNSPDGLVNPDLKKLLL